MKQWIKKGLSLLGVMAMLLTVIPMGMVMAGTETGFDVPDGYTLQAISTQEELAAIKTGSSAAKVYYYLTRDIDVTTNTFGIGTNDSTDLFWDILDGNGYAINLVGSTGNGVAMSGKSNWNGGLIMATKGDAVIKNLTITGTVTSSAQSSGVFVGRMVSGTIDNCVNQAVLKGTNQYVGGFVGRLTDGTIRNCTNLGNVSGTNCVGGIAGIMMKGVVVNCVNLATVNASKWAGGVAGALKPADGVTAEQAAAGVTTALIANSANAGTVSATWLAGGISAGLSNSASSTATATNAYGFRIENCYNAGKAKATSSTNSNNNDPIVARQSLTGVTTASVNCYALQGSASPIDASVTVYDAATMQSDSFINTLNANVQAGITYKTAADGEAISVGAGTWVKNVEGYPVFATTALPLRAIRVACVGDSITAGNGASNSSKNYVSQLQTLLGSRYNVQNFGNSGKTLLSGNTNSYDQTTEYQSSIDFAPDVVTIMLGSNDSKPAYWNATNFESELTAMVQMYRALDSKPIVILATSPTVYDDGDGNWNITDTVIFNEVAPIQRRVAESMNCVLVDTNANTRNWLTESSTYLSDGVHPTDAGYTVLANLFATGITEACARIHTFSVAGQDAAIDHEKNTITVTKTADVDWTAQTPTMTVVNGAAVTPKGVQNFTTSLAYTVESPDLKTTRTYTVVLAEEPDDDTPVEPEPEQPEVPEGYTLSYVSTEEDLKAIKTGKSASNIYYYMTNDIDITSDTFGIGTHESTDGFWDIFDGNGYAINFVGSTGNGVAMNGSNNWDGGLFVGLNGNAMVKNLILKGTVTSTAKSAGVLVGQMLNGTIDHCVNYANITGTGAENVGGLAGRVKEGVVVNCMNYGTVNGKQLTGGIVGSVSYSTAMTADEQTAGVVKVIIANCANFGNVTGTEKVGGILGLAAKDKTYRIENCYSTGTIKGSSTTHGAIVCCNWPNAVITNHCYALTGSSSKMLSATTKMEQADMQAQTFVDTLNANVTAGISYINAVGGTSITVPAVAWTYNENGYPTIDIPHHPIEITVQFIGKYQEPVATKTITSADELVAALASTTAPALGGYLFSGWSEDATLAGVLYQSACKSENRTLTIEAVYAVSEEKNNALTITGASGQDGLNNTVNSGDKLGFDTRVTVTADATPAYWVLDGAKVGFGQTTYTFYVSGNNTIEAVYEVAETIAPEVVLQQTKWSTNGERYNLSVIAQTSIPADVEYTDLSYGVYYTASESAIQDLPNGGANIQAKSSKTGANQQYMTHLLSVAEGRTRFARAYMQYTVNGEVVTLFSNQYVKFETATVADGEGNVTVTSYTML